MDIKIKRLSETLQSPPVYATSGSSGLDLIANNFKQLHMGNGTTNEVVTLPEGKTSLMLFPHSRVLIGCGFAVEVPEGYELQIRSRSGLALKKGLVVLNAPGTIDSDYRGEIGAIIVNTSNYGITVELGEKIAQAVLCKVEKVNWIAVTELSETKRGEGGFGHTGK